MRNGYVFVETNDVRRYEIVGPFSDKESEVAFASAAIRGGATRFATASPVSPEEFLGYDKSSGTSGDTKGQ